MDHIDQVHLYKIEKQYDKKGLIRHLNFIYLYSILQTLIGIQNILAQTHLKIMHF